MLWSAHGCKLLPAEVDFQFRYKDGSIVPANPPFLDVVSDRNMAVLFDLCCPRSHLLYETSLCRTMDSRRVPVKPDPRNQDEKIHLGMSSDGLRYFHPVALYEHNCQSSDGFLQILRVLQDVYGFFDNTKTSRYSILTLDVSLYNSFMHLLYGFGGFDIPRQTCFVFFGIWHAYMYAHHAIWDRYLCTYLADAYFAVFPKGWMEFVLTCVQVQ